MVAFKFSNETALDYLLSRTKITFNRDDDLTDENDI